MIHDMVPVSEHTVHRVQGDPLFSMIYLLYNVQSTTIDDTSFQLSPSPDLYNPQPPLFLSGLPITLYTRLRNLNPPLFVTSIHLLLKVRLPRRSYFRTATLREPHKFLPYGHTNLFSLFSVRQFLRCMVQHTVLMKHDKSVFHFYSMQVRYF